MAFLWLSASAHCELASIDGFTFLACSSEFDYSGQPCSDRSECGCFAVEKSQYNAGQLRVTLPSPSLQLVLSTPVADAEKSLPAEVCIGILTAAPPEFSRIWQFASRTALPVRAPAFVA
ncbi:MAG: hypothetical protein WDN00_00740 [Limisphaerales bacterium]